jgi:hypothetical protein
MQLVLFRLESTVVIVEDRRPRGNAALSHGFVSQSRITCPFPGWRFDRGDVVSTFPAPILFPFWDRIVPIKFALPCRH